MTMQSLIVPAIDLQPSVPAYGALRLQKGIWDQLQARRAYHSPSQIRAAPARSPAVIDLEA